MLKKQINTWIKVFIAILLVLSTINMNSYVRAKASIEGKNGNNKNYSREYVKYLELSEEEKSKVGVIPRKHNVPLDMIYENTKEVKEKPSITNLFGILSKTRLESEYAEELPERYNLAEHIDILVENQGNSNSCWAFSALNSLETYLLIHGYGEYDFSENHLAHMETTLFPQTLGNFVGLDYDDGGNFDLFEDYLAREMGPVLEEEVPLDKIFFEKGKEKPKDDIVFGYTQELDYDDRGLEYISNLTPKAYVTETVRFPTIDKSNTYADEELRLFREKVKKHIMDNGSLYAGLSFDDNFYSKETNALYVPSEQIERVGHGVSIIGWDDNYPKENFFGEKPSKNGAYICLNSYGKGEDDEGIVYVSYEDFYVEQDIAGIKEAYITKQLNTENKLVEEISFNDQSLYGMIKNCSDCISYNDENLSLVCVKAYMDYITMWYYSEEEFETYGPVEDITGIEKFTDLQALALDNHNVTDLSVLSDLEEFSYLDLSGNKNIDLATIPDVEELYLKDCNITNLASLNNMNKLSILDVSGNENINLETIPNVKELRLRDCNITSVSSLSNKSKLEKLDVSENQNLDLTNIPNVTSLGIAQINAVNNSVLASIVQGHNNLKELDISYTSVTDISPLTNLSDLKSINLSGNKNININSITQLTQINKLILQDVDIENYENLLDIINIKDLDVSDNKIKEMFEYRGYGIGYAEGEEKGIRDVLFELDFSLNINEDTEYAKGYIEGYIDGYLEYFVVNYNEDYESGYETGYEEGQNAETLNYVWNIANEYDKGHTIGYLEGYSKKLFDTRYLHKEKERQYAIKSVCLDNNNISFINYDQYYKLISANNQNAEIELDIIQGKENRLREIGTMLCDLFENVTLENCELDYENKDLIINSNQPGIARIKATSTYYDEYKTAINEYNLKINFNVVPSLEIVKLEVDTEKAKLNYIKGENFNTEGLEVRAIYSNGISEKLSTYQVINGNNLNSESKIKIRYLNVEEPIQIDVSERDEIKTARFNDKKLYEEVKKKLDEADSRYIISTNDQTKEITYSEKNMILSEDGDIEYIEDYFPIKVKNINDLTGISNFKTITEVILIGGNYTSIEEIANLPNLQELTIKDNNHITDIDKIISCKNLRRLILENTPIPSGETIMAIYRDKEMHEINIKATIENNDLANNMALPYWMEYFKNEYEKGAQQTFITDERALSVSNNYIKKDEKYAVSTRKVNASLINNINGVSVVLDREITEEKPEENRYARIKIIGGSLKTNEENNDEEYDNDDDDDEYEYDDDEEYDNDDDDDEYEYDDDEYDDDDDDDDEGESYDKYFNIDLRINYEANENAVITSGIPETTLEYIVISGIKYITPITVNNNQISNVLTQTNFRNCPFFRATDKAGNNLLATDKLSTGNIVEVLNERGETIEQYGFTIKGDINGDGEFDILDLSKIILQLIGKELLNEPQMVAADLKKDQEIDILDLSKMILVLLGKKSF